jgi:hypothetical protein
MYAHMLQMNSSSMDDDSRASENSEGESESSASENSEGESESSDQFNLLLTLERLLRDNPDSDSDHAGSGSDSEDGKAADEGCYPFTNLTTALMVFLDLNTNLPRRKLALVMDTIRDPRFKPGDLKQTTPQGLRQYYRKVSRLREREREREPERERERETLSITYKHTSI